MQNTPKETRNPDLCVDCDEVRTSSRTDGVALCAVCSNKRYSNDLSNGRRVELKIKLSDYSKGTLEEIKIVLAKNKI